MEGLACRGVECEGSCRDKDMMWSKDSRHGLGTSPVNTVWLEKALMVCWSEDGRYHSLLRARAREAAGFHWPWLPLGKEGTG